MPRQRTQHNGVPAKAPAEVQSNLFHRTKMCKFFIMNACTRGDQCQYAHNKESLIPLPDLSCTKLCPELINTGECSDPRCTFAHSRSELRPASGAQGRKPAKQRIADYGAQDRMVQRADSKNIPGGYADSKNIPGGFMYALPLGLQVTQGRASSRATPPFVAPSLDGAGARCMPVLQMPMPSDLPTVSGQVAEPEAEPSIPMSPGYQDYAEEEFQISDQSGTEQGGNDGSLTPSKSLQKDLSGFDFPNSPTWDRQISNVSSSWERQVSGEYVSTDGVRVSVKSTFLDIQAEGKPALHGLRRVHTSPSDLKLQAPESDDDETEFEPLSSLTGVPQRQSTAPVMMGKAMQSPQKFDDMLGFLVGEEVVGL